MILDQIIADVRLRLAERKQRMPLAELKHKVNQSRVCRDLQKALRGNSIQLIAEVKRASPSRGWLRPDIDIAALAHSYAQGGAVAISVLTEATYFKGSLADLAAVRQKVSLPLLCKDFVLDPYQIYEARAHGADAILLIATILPSSKLADLVKVTYELGMSALVEVHTEPDIEKALATKTGLIGINNRNLADFSVDLTTTLRLRPLLPHDITVVSESGIKSHGDILLLQKAGVNAVLVGEALISSSDPKAKVEELIRGDTLPKQVKSPW